MSITTINMDRYRGDTYPINITITNKSTGLPVNITNHSFILHIQSLFNVTGTITNAAGGKVSFALLPAQVAITGKYKFDIQMTDSSGYIRTIAVGTVVFKADI